MLAGTRLLKEDTKTTKLKKKPTEKSNYAVITMITRRKRHKRSHVAVAGIS